MISEQRELAHWFRAWLGIQLPSMITGAHVLFYSTEPEADRAFLRDFLKLRAIDVGEGWLIFTFPPTEAAVHPAEHEHLFQHGGRPMLGAVVYLMCDDLRETMASLKKNGVTFSPIEEAAWGIKTTIRLPSGGDLGLYQPLHPTAIGRTS